MPPLLVIPDPAPAEAAVLPELPALSGLIRLGTLAPDEEWRAGLLRDLGAAALQGIAPGAIAAQALSPRPENPVCVATPAHVVAGMSRVHLHGAGLVDLLPVDRSRLLKEFHEVFGAEMQLLEAGEGWVLQAPWAAAADDGDPAQLRGEPLSRLPAATPQAKALRCAGAEIEMWLAGLGWNQARARTGQLPVNILWLWGGAETGNAFSGLPPGVPLYGTQLFARSVDPWLAGLAALAGFPVQPLPSDWNQALTQCVTPQRAVTQNMAILLQSSTAPDASQWLEWERCWFEPALRALRDRKVACVTLRLGRRSWQARPNVWRTFLRRSRPWWQAMVA